MKKKMKIYLPNLVKYRTKEVATCENDLFPAISLTGVQCELNCEHCNKKFLYTLRDASTPEKLMEIAENLAKINANGFLLTGGSVKDGSVDLKPFVNTIKEIKKKFNFKIAFHSGLVNEETVKDIKDAKIDIVMIDIIGDNKTINEIYHLDKKVEDYEKALELLTKYEIPFAPHVLIGLYYGKTVGEIEALKFIKNYSKFIEKLVLIVYRPLEASKKDMIPDLKEVEKIFKYTKENFQDIYVSLGCARPFGDYRYKLDKMAVDCDFDSIVYPADGIMKYLEDKGIETEIINTCCSFI